MNIPIYKDGDSIVEYMKKVEKFTFQMNQHKYDVVLDFINEFFEKKYTSVLQFKYISENTLDKQTNKNKHIAEKYIPLFKDKLNVNIGDLDKLNEPTHIVFILNKITNAINYKLMHNTKNKLSFYSIRLR
jgi:hypothetical protein